MIPCEKTQELLTAYIDGKLEEALQQKIERHLAECAQCASEFDGLHLLVDHLDETARRTPHNAADVQLRQGLMASYDSGELQNAAPSAPARMARGYLLAVAAALAAITLLSVVLPSLFHGDKNSTSTDDLPTDGGRIDSLRDKLAASIRQHAEAFLAAPNGQVRHQRMMETCSIVNTFEDCELFEQVIDKLGEETGKAEKLEDLIHIARSRASMGRIALTVESLEKTYARMDSVQLRITLTNLSDETVRVRPYFNITVRDESGKLYDPFGILRDNRQAHSGLIELLPRASTTIEEMLNPFEHATEKVPQYIFNKAGHYTVRLGYRLFPHLLEEWGVIERDSLQTWHDFACGEEEFSTAFVVK